jgi:hypothetical protein
MFVDGFYMLFTFGLVEYGYLGMRGTFAYTCRGYQMGLAGVEAWTTVTSRPLCHAHPRSPRKQDATNFKHSPVR